MQTRLKIDNFNNLYDYWGDSLYKEILDESHIIINLASKEYSKCIEPYLDKKDKFITIAFMEKCGNKYISKNTYSKIARGVMVNYLVKNNITNIDYKIVYDKEFVIYTRKEKTPIKNNASTIENY